MEGRLSKRGIYIMTPKNNWRLCYSWGEIEEASGGFWWCITYCEGASSVSEIENNQITLSIFLPPARCTFQHSHPFLSIRKRSRRSKIRDSRRARRSDSGGKGPTGCESRSGVRRARAGGWGEKQKEKGRKAGFAQAGPKIGLLVLLRRPFFFWESAGQIRTGASGFRSQRTKSVPAFSSVTGLRSPIGPQKRDGNKITRHKLWINDGVVGAEWTS